MGFTTRHADVFAAVNLARNGGLDFVEVQGSVQIPHFWAVSVPHEATSREKSYFNLELAEQIEAAGEPRRFFRLFVSSREAVTLKQSFVADPTVNTLDFPQPLDPNTERLEMVEGYRSLDERLLQKSRGYSVGVSIRIPRGKVDVQLRFEDINGVTLTEEVLTERRSPEFAGTGWARFEATMTPSEAPARIALIVTRVDSSDLAEVHVGHFQLVLGGYDEVPYTGDVGVEALPKDTVIISMGDACPPGFTELEEPDGVAVPTEWTDADSEAKARRRAFPIGVDGAVDPSDLQGSPAHAKDDVVFSPVLSDVENFESFDSILGNPPYINANIDSPADEPAPDGTPDHQHVLADGGSIPANRPFRLCRRL